MSPYLRDENRHFRAAFVVLSLAFAAVTVWAIADETWVRRPWKQWQETYAQLRPARAAEVAVAQVVVPELGVVDRCITCHAGIDDPAMTGPGVPRVLRVHPQRDTLLRQHPVPRFGCTPCHRGQGLALTAGTAHGEADPHWQDPMLRGRYVQASCLGCHADQESLAGAPDLNRGRRAFRELGCGGCHAHDGAPAEPKRGPSLRKVSAKLEPGYLLAWIRDPQARRAHHRMPQFWPDAHKSPAQAELRDRESVAIAAYLVQTAEPWPAAATAPPADPALAAAGQQLFDRVGCRGCHALGGQGRDDVVIREAKPDAQAGNDAWDSFGEAPEPAAATATAALAAHAAQTGDFAPPLGELAARVRPGFVFAWLQDPTQYWPEATMPTPRLTRSEAHALASWLTTAATTPKLPAPPALLAPIDPALAQAGKKLIGTYGCFGCHDIAGFEQDGRPGPDLSDYGTKDPRDMHFGAAPPPRPQRTWARFTETKLRTPRALATADIHPVMPQWALSEPEVLGLAVYLRGLRANSPPAAYRVQPPRAAQHRLAERVIEERGCRQCHKLDGQAGAIARYYGDAHLAPPQLDGAGARLQPQWLYGYLLDPGPLRPWLEVRMPRFRLTAAEAEAVTAWLAERAEQPPSLRPLATRPLTPERAQLGAQLLDRLKCVTCHRMQRGEGVETAQLAPDLGLARQRLDPAWIRKFLQDPDKLLPGTRMPQFFPDGQTPVHDILGGDAGAQIDLLVDYLMHLGLLPVATDADARPESDRKGDAP